MPAERRVIIELERSTDCHEALWHTRHDESKYDRYEENFKSALASVAGDADYVYVRNPGPKAHGMHCKQSQYNKKLWHSMVKNDKTQRWYPDVTFCYPRVGSFEVTAIKGKQRVPIFSKLTIRKWPSPEWLATKVQEIVEGKLGGWEPAAVEVKVERQYATKKMTDDELRQLIKKKFSTLIGAFRAFDKNGDGMISKTEFMKGIRNSGVDLPPAQLEQLWKMADEDGTGNLQYQEFARKFASYKATHSLHRHANYKDDGKQQLVQSLHGVDAASRVQKSAAIRNSESLEWGVDGEKLAEDPDAVMDSLNFKEKSIGALSRDAEVMKKPLAEMSPDEVRAKIYKKHGNIVNAFRHFDVDGSSSINYEEFMSHLPTVLGEPITQMKMEELWRAYDPDLSGEIDMKEFASSKIMGHLATEQGLATFKGHAVDPTLAYAHVTTKDSMVVEKRYNTTGGMSQIATGKDVPKAPSPSDNSTAAPSPADQNMATLPPPVIA
jgi:Ca2+-binding EF-hand superfamily protein